MFRQVNNMMTDNYKEHGIVGKKKFLSLILDSIFINGLRKT